jgi:hypothetical protein
VSTDLTSVNDHPIAILKREQELFKSEDMISILGPAQASQSANGLGVAIDTLSAYEKANAVVFAALDSDTLAQVQFIFDSDDISDTDFRGAVSDLLGLE